MTNQIAVRNSLTGRVETFAMTDHEVLPLTFDLGPLLAEDEEVASATVELVNRRTDALFPDGLDGDVAIDGTGALVTQAVANLERGGRYRLKMLCVVGTKQWEPYLDIDCLDG